MIKSENGWWGPFQDKTLAIKAEAMNNASQIGSSEIQNGDWNIETYNLTVTKE